MESLVTGFQMFLRNLEQSLWQFRSVNLGGMDAWRDFTAAKNLKFSDAFRLPMKPTLGIFAFNIGEELQVGGYWISSMGESDALEELTIDNMENSEADSMAYGRVAGAGGFASLQIGRFVADAEYVTATEDFASGALGQTELRPAAWNIEAGIRFNVCEAEIAFKYEGSDEFPGFPEQQYGIGSSLRVSQSATLAIEYLHGEFEDETEDRNVVTAQLGIEF